MAQNVMWPEAYYMLNNVFPWASASFGHSFRTQMPINKVEQVEFDISCKKKTIIVLLTFTL